MPVYKNHKTLYIRICSLLFVSNKAKGETAHGKKYDVIVIGAGPGGMTAALYASRANLSVLMLDRGVYGGQMNNTAEVENYPGYKSILGPDLGQKMYDGATQFGAEYAYGNVISVQNHGATKLVKTDEDEFEAKAIVIATGAEHKNSVYPAKKPSVAGGIVLRGLRWCVL